MWMHSHSETHISIFPIIKYNSWCTQYTLHIIYGKVVSLKLNYKFNHLVYVTLRNCGFGFTLPYLHWLVSVYYRLDVQSVLHINNRLWLMYITYLLHSLTSQLQLIFLYTFICSALYVYIFMYVYLSD